MKRSGPPSRHTPLSRDTPGARDFVDRGRRSSATALQESGRRSAAKAARDGGGFRASPAQREATRAVGYCIACGATEEFDRVPLDPAHLISRKHGGCNSRFCTVALCRRCHDRFDGRTGPRLDLLSVLVGDWDRWRHHCQHALRHVTPNELVERLSGARTQWSDVRAGGDSA